MAYSDAFSKFLYGIGDIVRHRSSASGAPAMVVERSLSEGSNADGQPIYDRVYHLVGYGVDADATEMELELVRRKRDPVAGDPVMP